MAVRRYKQERDEDLAILAAQGEEDAVEELVRRYSDPARRACLAILKDPEGADDAAQDGFLAALSGLGTYDPGRPFGPWFLRIVANAARDRLRREKVRLTDAIPVDAQSSEELPDKASVRTNLREDLQAALNQLPERQRLAVVLFEVEGYSHAEIAEILEVPAGTVRSDVSHARKKLRELISQWKD